MLKCRFTRVWPVLGLVAGLTACAAPGGQKLTPVQVIDKAALIVDTAGKVAPLMFVAAPAAFPPAAQARVLADITLAQTELAKLRPDMPATAAAVSTQAIETYVNDGLGVLVDVAATVPAAKKYMPMLVMIQVAAPILEDFFNQTFPPAAGTVAAGPAAR